MDNDDEDRKSVIDQMMGELDDVTADSLKKPKGPVKGVEISITVAPKSEEMSEDMPECTDEDCEIPEHHHGESDEKPEEESNYISQLLKKLG